MLGYKISFEDEQIYVFYLVESEIFLNTKIGRLVKMLWECCGWTKNRTYRIFGAYYPRYKVVEFKMSDAAELSEDMFCESE